ncbi:zinc finger domain-containing protein [Micromonospora globispora]|uniref:zinc finger domain-containing protein n=1 Tax=Micromonospora globispora TaxID=1450148 RepID=UPI000F4F8721|nr:hypothetical protein [Micromonospora globispora]
MPRPNENPNFPSEQETAEVIRLLRERGYDENAVSALLSLGEALFEVHHRAVTHDDDSLHRAADRIVDSLVQMGYPQMVHPLLRHCPVCGSLPGQRCIKVPGHPLGEQRYHAERWGDRPASGSA